MPVTLRDIAKRADVSHATVSVVLNNRPAPVISESTRAKVLKVAAELGYQPNHLARALATGRSNVVAVWVESPYTPYNAQFLQAIHGVVRDKPFDLMVIDAPAQTSGIDFNRSHWPVDGVIAINSSRRVERYIAANPSSSTPIVTVGTAATGATDSVCVSLEDSVRASLERLRREAPARIGYLTASDADDDPLDRLVSEWGQEQGVLIEPLCADTDSRSAGRALMLDRLGRDAPLSGVLAKGDVLAVGAVSAMRERGAVLSVVATADTEELAYQSPSVSAIEHPVREMCEAAWELFESRLENRKLPIRSRILEARLKLRG